MTTSLIAGSSGGGGATQLIILLLIPLAMYFLLIRPQRRRMREQQSMQRSIQIGDEVVTTSGIYGIISGIEDDRFWLEIDDDVQIRISRAAVQARTTPVAGDTEGAATDGSDENDGS